MRAWQRFFIGPLISLSIVIAVTLFDRSGMTVPYPGAIGFLPIVAALYLSGTRSGLLSTAIALANTAILFPVSGGVVQFQPDSWLRAGFLLTIVVVVSFILERERRMMARTSRARDELAMLSAVLDEVQHGVVVLDGDLCIKFANAAFRRIWRYSDSTNFSGMTFEDMLQHSRSLSRYAVPFDQLDDYLRRRVELVRRGEVEPLDLNLVNGEVIRFECAVLPEGGRMLSYLDVTDLYRHSKELEVQAHTDSLTGLANRRWFFEVASVEWKKSRRYNRPLSLLMLDIDWFKTINDRFGHAAGDRVIERIAQMCRNCPRSADLAARIGGEEFAILLPETDLTGAFAAATRLRMQIADLRTEFDDELIVSTVSIGAATINRKMKQVDDLVRAADEALYQAKQNGRNRVEAKVLVGRPVGALRR